jgi:fructokinase
VIVVAGESLIDLVVADDGTVRASPGGGPYNAARALARLGMPVAFLGRVSTDSFGRLLRDGLAADGVDTGRLVATDDPTLLAVADVGADGIASYRFHSDGTAAVGLTTTDIVGGLPDGTTALHVGSLGLVLEPMAATIEGIVLAGRREVLVLLDPNIRPAAIADPATYRARLDRVLARIDIVKASVDDLAWLEPARDPVGAARRLLDRGPALVIVTDGPRPARVASVGREDVVAIEVPPVAVTDTIGAGDAFGAGFLAWWTHAGFGRDRLPDRTAVAAATRFAIGVGSATATRPGAEPPTIAELARAGLGW